MKIFYSIRGPELDGVNIVLGANGLLVVIPESQGCLLCALSQGHLADQLNSKSSAGQPNWSN